MVVAWLNRHGALRSGSESDFERAAIEKGDVREIARAYTLAALEDEIIRLYPNGLPRAVVLGG